MKLVTTLLPPNTYLVRVCDGEGPEYTRMIVVTVDGDSLFLQGWIGDPLTPTQWRAAATKEFRGAKRVRFKRYRRGEFREVELKLW